MALIQCPECGKEISDKVTACPHCGYPLVEEQVQPASPQAVELTGINLSVKNPQKSKKFLIYATVVVCVIVAVVVGLTVKKANDTKKAANEYIDNLTAVRRIMLTGAVDAEKLCGLTHDVWYNTIYEKYDFDTDPYTKDDNGSYHDDFNDSLSALYSDQSTKDAISDIKSNRDSVDELMKQLQNPTDEFSACYATVDALYDAYCGLTNLATSPTGSLTSYTESYRTYDDDFLKYYKKLETQIPEKQQ